MHCYTKFTAGKLPVEFKSIQQFKDDGDDLLKVTDAFSQSIMISSVHYLSLVYFILNVKHPNDPVAMTRLYNHDFVHRVI